jgi:hypothetical protein
MITQSVRAAINTAKARASIDTTEDGKQPTFHEKEIARRNADPQNGGYLGARAIGLARASAFLKSATNTMDKEHETNHKLFKDVYQFDSKRLEADFIDQVCNEMNAAPFEMRDPNYERNLIAKYKPTTIESALKQKYFDNFCADIQKKWARVGYKGDQAFVAAYSEKYNLPANDHLQQHRDFQPKK